MADRPEDFPDFATNPNYTTGPQVGQPTKVPMDALYVADGNKRGLDNAPDAQKFNWWMNGVGRWIRFFADLFPSGGSAGEVLTSNGDGTADWQPASGGGGDLSNTNPVPVNRTPASPGTSSEAARADHKHDAEVANVVTIGSANAPGTGSALALASHVHAHGNQAGGTLHALVSTTTAGFMSPADKSKLDGLGGGGGGGGDSAFLNVLDAGVVQGALANTAAREANLAAFNAAIQTAVASNKILVVPQGDYEIAGGSGIVIDQSFFRWLGTQNSRIKQFTLNAPVVHVGPPYGTSGVVEGVVMDGFELSYAGVGTEGADALQLTGVWISVFRNGDIGDTNAPLPGRTSVPWDSIHLDGTAGTSPPFSNTFENLRLKHFGHAAIYAPRPGFDGASTGSVWSNIYISGGDGENGQQDTSANGSPVIFMQMQAQGKFHQLNIEWLHAPGLIGLDSSAEMVFESLNIEGTRLKAASADNLGIFQLGFSRMSVDGLTINNNAISSANNVANGCVAKFFGDCKASFSNVRIENTQVTGTSWTFIRNWSGGGDAPVHVDLARIQLNSNNNLQRFDDFLFPSGEDGALFGILSDFNNFTPITLPNADQTIYAYMTPGVCNIPASATRNITLSHRCGPGSDQQAIIPRGVSRTIRNTGSASAVIKNHDGATLATLPAGGSGTFVFDRFDWTNQSIGGGGGGGGGVDLTTSPPALVTRSAAQVGVATTAARADHKHDVFTAPPIPIGSNNVEGSSQSLARADHVHAHGSQAGGTAHALANLAIAGFMSPSDKAHLDALYTALFQPRDQPLLGVESEFEGLKTFTHIGQNYPTQVSATIPFQNYRIYLNIPIYVDRIASLRVTLRGGSGHSALPQFKPGIALYRNITTLVASQGDTAASVSAYQADHDVVLTGPFGLTTEAFHVQITGESGSNALAGLSIRRLQVTWASSVA